MASKTALDQYTANIRRLHDNALKISGKLRAFNNITLYRYSIKETDYKDETKTLLSTNKWVTIYLDYPGDISNLSSNTPFIEDNLPIMVMFPWFDDCNRVLKVDIKDEFEITLKTEFGVDKIHRFEITDRHSIFEENHLERSFIVAPKRVSTVDLNDTGVGTGAVNSEPDPNYAVETNLEDDFDVISEYD